MLLEFLLLFQQSKLILQFHFFQIWQTCLGHLAFWRTIGATHTWSNIRNLLKILSFMGEGQPHGHFFLTFLSFFIRQQNYIKLPSVFQSILYVPHHFSRFPPSCLLGIVLVHNRYSHKKAFQQTCTDLDVPSVSYKIDFVFFEEKKGIYPQQY